jgi:hypothetical protein
MMGFFILGLGEQVKVIARAGLLGKVLHSHLSDDETVAKMGHPGFMVGFIENVGAGLERRAAVMFDRCLAKIYS